MNVGIKRKIRGGDNDDVLRNKIINCLDSKPDACDGFGINVAETLRKFSPLNQEMVKAQLQIFLAKSLQCEQNGEPLPSLMTF